MKFLKRLADEEDLIVEVNNKYLNKSWIIRGLATILFGALIALFAICIGPFIFMLCIFSDIIAIFGYPIRRFILKPLLIKSKIIRINRIINNHQKNLLKDTKCYYLGPTIYVVGNQKLEDFIYNFIVDYRNIYYTIDLDRGVVCDLRRRRSLGDIFLICRHYYPECSIVDVLKILIKLLETRKIYGSYCGTICKYVFHLDSNGYHRDNPVEYDDNIKFRDLVDVYYKQENVNGK